MPSQPPLMALNRAIGEPVPAFLTVDAAQGNKRREGPTGPTAVARGQQTLQWMNDSPAHSHTETHTVCSAATAQHICISLLLLVATQPQHRARELTGAEESVWMLKDETVADDGELIHVLRGQTERDWQIFKKWAQMGRSESEKRERQTVTFSNPFCLRISENQ